MFVGHSHLQRTDRYRSPAGNELTEVNIGALSGYPVPMVQVTVTDDLQVQMQVEHLATFDWYGRRWTRWLTPGNMLAIYCGGCCLPGPRRILPRSWTLCSCPGTSCCLCIHW